MTSNQFEPNNCSFDSIWKSGTKSKFSYVIDCPLSLSTFYSQESLGYSERSEIMSCLFSHKKSIGASYDKLQLSSSARSGSTRGWLSDCMGICKRGICNTFVCGTGYYCSTSAISGIICSTSFKFEGASDSKNTVLSPSALIRNAFSGRSRAKVCCLKMGYTSFVTVPIRSFSSSKSLIYLNAVSTHRG